MEALSKALLVDPGQESLQPLLLSKYTARE